jgi:peptidoglycan hydrolase-like protein with peptidoglycan-binding domain
MRFREFNILVEAAKGTQADVAKFDQPGYFTVGDSHSNGVSNYGRGKTWKALGMDGASAFDPMHPAQIKKIPKGSVVAISLGANDVGKPVQSVVNQVQSVISAAEQQGLTVVYLLPTTAKIEKKKGDIQKREELRAALSSAIKVPTIDLGVATAGDGVHHQPGVYLNFAKQIQSSESVKSGGSDLGTSEKKPGAPTTKDRINTSDNLEQGPPFPADQSDEVKKMQQGLESLGYSVGRLGIDGKYGPATAAAVAAFKKDYNLSGKASSFGENEFKIIAQIQSGQIAKVKEPTKVNDYSKDGTGLSGTKETNVAFKEPFFMEKLKKVAANLGVSEKDLIGIMKHESELNPRAVNPFTKATGLIQFMPKTARSLGTTVDEIYKMSATEQLDFVEKYYKSNNVRAGDDIGDLYMSTFMPAAKDKPDSFVLGNINGGSVFGLSAAAIYKQNKTFDSNRDGIFTVGDVKDRIRRFA